MTPREGESTKTTQERNDLNLNSCLVSLLPNSVMSFGVAFVQGLEIQTAANSLKNWEDMRMLQQHLRLASFCKPFLHLLAREYKIMQEAPVWSSNTEFEHALSESVQLF